MVSNDSQPERAFDLDLGFTVGLGMPFDETVR
jgi:hypothetical protein